MLTVLVERHNPEVVRRGQLDDVTHDHLGVVVSHERPERIPQFLEQLGVPLTQGLAEDNVVVPQE